MSRRSSLRVLTAGAAAALTLTALPAANAVPALPSLPTDLGGLFGGSSEAEAPQLPALPDFSTMFDNSNAARSGSGIILTLADGSQGVCTLNSVVMRDGVPYGVTAGHCFEPHNGNPVVRVSTLNDEVTLANADDIAAGGHVLEGEASPFSPTEPLNDFAYFRLAPGVQQDATGVTSHPNTGLPLVDSLLTSPRIEQGEPQPVTNALIGSPVCKDGAMTGRTCGIVLMVNEQSQEVFAAIPAIAGDSGSPLWTLGPDGRAHVVGSLSNGTPVLFNIFDGTQEHLARLGV